MFVHTVYRDMNARVNQYVSKDCNSIPAIQYIYVNKWDACTYIYSQFLNGKIDKFIYSIKISEVFIHVIHNIASTYTCI